MTETVNRYTRARQIAEAVLRTMSARGTIDPEPLLDHMRPCASEDTIILARTIIHDAYFNPDTEGNMTGPAVAERFTVLMRSTRLEVHSLGRRRVQVNADWEDDRVQSAVAATLKLLKNEAVEVRTLSPVGDMKRFTLLLVNKQTPAYFCNALGYMRYLCPLCFARRDDTSTASTFFPLLGNMSAKGHVCIECEARL
jgi:hypothetical protein